MIELEVERDIPRSVDEVLARLADIDHYQVWLPKSVVFRAGGVVTPVGEVEHGTELIDITPFGRLSGRVTLFEPPTRIGFEQTLRRFGKTVFISRPSHELTETENGTHLRHHGEAEVFGVFSPAEPLIRILAVRERTRVVDALARSFESA